MIQQCAKCKLYFDDEFRTTVCPHEAFNANDGKNNFKVHHDAYRSKKSPDEIKPATWDQGGLYRCCVMSIPIDAMHRIIEGEEGEHRPCAYCKGEDNGVVFHKGVWMSPVAKRLREKNLI